VKALAEADELTFWGQQRSWRHKVSPPCGNHMRLQPRIIAHHLSG